MKTITLNIPDEVKLDDVQTARFLAAKLYESGILTLGHAALIAGLSKMAFSEILADYNVALFNHSADEIKKDADII